MAASCVGAAVSVWLREDDLSCVICHELLDCATTLPCGHSFCLQCLDDLWVTQHAGMGGRPWACPLCREGLTEKPKLHKNTLLQDLVDKYRRAAQESQAGPEPASEPESPPQPAPPQVGRFMALQTVLAPLYLLLSESLLPAGNVLRLICFPEKL